ncbi:MAG: NINE protein [Sphaerospermopsis sp. SIO1G2]|nr:NINE protein [Sphaerospermopsis sp. SIO1G2]
MNTEKNAHQERIIASYVLCIAGFLGAGGLHRLYNGKIATGLLWFFTFGFFYVGQVVDVLLIPGMVDEYEHKLRLKAGMSPSGSPMNQPVVNTQVYQPKRMFEKGRLDALMLLRGMISNPQTPILS